MVPALAAIDVAFFTPILVAGFVAGLIARRWIVLVVPAVVWLVFGVVGTVSWTETDRGNPVVMFVLIGLYFPVPLGLAAAVGIALGRVVRSPGSRRHEHSLNAGEGPRLN